MATDRLALYNIALAAHGERSLSSLDEEGEARRLLDEVYTRGKGAISFFLEQGYWNFAMRAVKLDSSTSVTPEFGYSFAFQIPDDFIRLNMISADERFGWPMTDYEFEGGGYIYVDVDPLYLRYVSDGEDWGKDFSKWPETFTLWAGHWMATQTPKLNNGNKMEDLRKETNRLLVDARSKDASQEPTRWPPLSSWAQARFGRHYRRDRGLRSKLIGS